MPNLRHVRWTWQLDHERSDEPADEYMQRLLDSLDALKEEFADERAILSDINREIADVEEWISENTHDDPSEHRPSRTFADIETPDHPSVQHRGIFDDVDE